MPPQSLALGCQLVPFRLLRDAPPHPHRPTQASARSHGHNIFPYKSLESLLPLIDALDKMGELGKCAHAGRPGPLKKGQVSLVVRGSAGKPSATAGH